MTLNTRFGIALLAGLAATAPVWAQNNNGTRDTAFYGSALAVQTAGTQFGDAGSGNVDFTGGSELDAIYARIGTTSLHVFLSGNLESNYNKLELFFDTGAGGQNVLRNDNAGVDFNGLNALSGLTLPSDFTADYYFTAGGGNTAAMGAPPVYRLFANFATLPTMGGGVGTYLGNNGAASSATPIDGTDLGTRFTVNNSNTAGVTNTVADSSAALAVLTGIEIEIPFALLGGVPANGVKLFAFVNSSDHTFVSNQSLGGLPSGTGNLGGPGTVNFTTAGASSVNVAPAVVVPEAGSGVLALLPLLGIAAGVVVRRARKN